MMKAVMRTLARAALNRSDAAILKSLKAAPLVIRGRTLDPKWQFIAAQAAKQPQEAPTPETGRAATQGMVYMFGGKLEPGVAVEDTAFAAPGRQIPLRLYRPAKPDPAAPVLVYYHFGGGVVGDLNTCHAFCSKLARVAGGAVVSVGYRLAPEHRFPAGIDDAEAAYAWAVENAERLGARAGKAAVGGDSMGGNFSAIVAQTHRGKPTAPVVQLLIYPATDLGSTHASMTDFGEAFPLTKATMDWFMSLYLPEGAKIEDPRLSPARAGDLSGLSPALIYTAGFDPLSDQGEAYAAQLKAVGVPVHFKCFEDQAHAFTAFTGAIPRAEAACAEIASAYARAVREGVR